MPLYEHTFLARQEISAQAAESLAQTFKGVLEEVGGKVGKTEYWGIRTLAYRINKNRKAHYVMMNLDAPHEAVHEMERQMRLHSDILRYLTVRVDALEEGPSVMMQKRERNERGDRGDRRGSRGRDGAESRGQSRNSEGNKSEKQEHTTQ